MSRQPRFDCNLWQGHGALAERIALKIAAGDVAGAQQVLADDVAEFGNLMGAILQGYRNATAAPPAPVIMWDIAWGDGTRHATRDILHAPFTIHIISAQLDVPVGLTPFGVVGYVAVYEYGGGAPWLREMSVSTFPGVFDPNDPAMLFSSGNRINFNIGPGTDVAMASGQRYWINVRNVGATPETDGRYDAAIEFQWPHS